MSSEPQENFVTVKMVYEEHTNPLTLEVRLYIRTNFDCMFLLETGNARGLIDTEVETILYPRGLFEATVYLTNLQRMAMRVKVPNTSIFDVVNFTVIDHASRILQNLPRNWHGRYFRVTIQKTKVHRDSPGRKSPGFLCNFR